LLTMPAGTRLPITLRQWMPIQSVWQAATAGRLWRSHRQSGAATAGRQPGEAPGWRGI